MTHLTEDQLYKLAELTIETQSYEAEELAQMEHLKACKSCYEKFCTLLALLDATSESGYTILSEVFSKANKKVKVNHVSENILAVLKVIRNNIEKTVSCVIEQIGWNESQFQFEPQLAFATRGIDKKNSTLYKVENVDDEKTFVVFDSANNQLMAQINTKSIPNKEIHIYLEFEDGRKMDIPVIRKGNLVKATIDNLPDENFKIHMEKVVM